MQNASQRRNSDDIARRRSIYALWFHIKASNDSLRKAPTHRNTIAIAASCSVRKDGNRSQIQINLGRMPQINEKLEGNESSKRVITFRRKSDVVNRPNTLFQFRHRRQEVGQPLTHRRTDMISEAYSANFFAANTNAQSRKSFSV